MLYSSGAQWEDPFNIPDPSATASMEATHPSGPSWDSATSPPEAIVGITVEEPYNRSEASPGFGGTIYDIGLTGHIHDSDGYFRTPQYDDSHLRFTHLAGHESLVHPHTPRHRARSCASDPPTFDHRPRANSDSLNAARGLQGSALHAPQSRGSFQLSIHTPAPVYNLDFLSPSDAGPRYPYAQSCRGSDSSSNRSSVSPAPPSLDSDQGSTAGSDFDDSGASAYGGSLCADGSYDTERLLSPMVGHLDQVIHLTEGLELNCTGPMDVNPLYLEGMSSQHGGGVSPGPPGYQTRDTSGIFSGPGFTGGMGAPFQDDGPSQVRKGPAPTSSGKAVVATKAGLDASRARRKDKTKRGAFKCDRCQSDFTAKHNLKSESLDIPFARVLRIDASSSDHMNSHDGVKTCSCDYCPRKFGTKHVRDRHALKCRAQYGR
ncbi:hypothetical protein B0H17DRAFT_1032353 [Mycena rosella]|uniref:Uncharacterized protein n=1 Tax=Mycena rosella TaxID=1033263 RepID=A0AAD7GXH0_MYCRO|nr:hypothetical protein B0H17DRAFT_1032353 [Mycena rosella]